MDQEANPYRYPPDSLPPAAAQPARRRIPRAALTVGLASFLAMAGAGAAFAVGGSGGSSPTSSSSGASSGSGSGSATTPVAPDGPGHGPGFFRGRGGFGPMGGMGPGGVVHGTFTVHNGTGYKTVEMQVGTVQSSNNSTSTKLVVKSSDNYSQSYVVQPSTVVNSQAGGISTVQKGDTVRVEAVQGANGFTATDIVDTSRISSSRQGFGFAPPAPPASSGSTSSAPQ